VLLELFLPEPDAKRNNPPLEAGYRGYVAGVLDCDGSIWISFEAHKQKPPRYALRIAVSNTRPALLTWFADQFGGTPGSYKSKHRNHKTEYRWGCTGVRAAEVIRCCLPYLVIKRGQALLALEYASTMGAGNPTLPASYHRMRQRIYTEMIKLNKRGTE
jgi:hypothetical protein